MLFPYLPAVHRFLRGTFRQGKTNRKNCRALCLIAAPRRFPGSRPVCREGKNGNFYMSAGLCRKQYTFEIARLGWGQ
jgi:hypothetical protein